MEDSARCGKHNRQITKTMAPSVQEKHIHYYTSLPAEYKPKDDPVKYRELDKTCAVYHRADGMAETIHDVAVVVAVDMPSNWSGRLIVSDDKIKTKAPVFNTLYVFHR